MVIAKSTGGGKSMDLNNLIKPSVVPTGNQNASKLSEIKRFLTKGFEALMNRKIGDPIGNASSQQQSGGAVHHAVESLLADRSSKGNPQQTEAISESSKRKFINKYARLTKHYNANDLQQQTSENQPSTQTTLNQVGKTDENIIKDKIDDKVLFHRMKEHVKKASKKYNVPEKMVWSIIRQESNFNPLAKSHAGAEGLMQLMPQTAKSLGVKNSFDMEQNIFGGVKYYRKMLDKFNNDPKLALAAYNAGPGAVEKYGGIPPYKETQAYVSRIMDFARG